ncbi:MAG: hypothetical protein Kow0059_12840 [Candidatus Sumerlaeia bacterium]
MPAQALVLAFLIGLFLYGVCQLALTVTSTLLSQIREFEGRFSLLALGAVCYAAAALGAIFTAAAQLMPEADVVAFEQARFSPMFLEWFFTAGLTFGLYMLLRRRIEVLWHQRCRQAHPAVCVVTPAPFSAAVDSCAGERSSGPALRRNRPLQPDSTGDGASRPDASAFGRSPRRRLIRRPFLRKTMLSELPFNQVYHLETVEFELEVPGLPPAFDGLKIAHLTDFHFTPDLDAAFYLHGLQLAQRWQPDVIALTGDFMSRKEHFGYGMQWLARLRAPLGVFAVRGNHDFWEHPERTAAMLEAQGVTLLANRAVRLERPGAAMTLAGVEHPWLPLRRKNDLELPADAPCRILLSHTPDNFPWAVRRGFALVLSGHTHGGQVRLPLVGSPVVASRYGQRYAAGLFCRKGAYLYVSKGLGCSVPLRINCTPEITLFRLRRPGGRSFS